MKLLFLGTSGSVVTRHRMCSGFLFEDKLIDVGFGVLANLVKSRNLDEINYLYVSHSHSDHIGDFTGLVWAMAIGSREKPLTVISSASTASDLQNIMRFQATPAGLVNFKIDFVRPLEKMCLKTIHEPENLAYRFNENGIDFVYTGDTSKYDAVSKFASGCDLLIHDGTFLRGQEAIAKLGNHSKAEDAASIAKQAETNRLVLTHIAPSNEGKDAEYVNEAQKEYEGDVVVAKDWLELDL